MSTAICFSIDGSSNVVIFTASDFQPTLIFSQHAKHCMTNTLPRNLKNKYHRCVVGRNVS